MSSYTNSLFFSLSSLSLHWISVIWGYSSNVFNSLSSLIQLMSWWVNISLEQTVSYLVEYKTLIGTLLFRHTAWWMGHAEAWDRMGWMKGWNGINRMTVFTFKAIASNSSEGNLEMELNLNTMNSTWHIAAHIYTFPHLSSSLYSCIQCVYMYMWRVGLWSMCVEGNLFLSQKSQDFELFMKCNQGYVKMFPLFSFFGTCAHVYLFVCIGVNTSHISS